MRKIFRKAMTIAGSAAMIGATVGAAAAASYTGSFTGSNTAMVVGSGAAMTDTSAANLIASTLDSSSSTTTTVEGGEVLDLYDNDKLYFGSAMNGVMSSALDDNDMDVLEDGEYDDGSIDTDTEQTVTLGSTSMSLITDDDLNDEEPTIGYHFDDATVLTYTLTFDDGALASAMAGTEMPLFGRDYYVLDAEAGKITLLNSAETAVLEEGDSVTIDGHTISIDWIDSAHDVKFSVDGEVTDKLDDGESYELDDEYYIVLKEGLYTEKDGAASKAEFSLGSGQVILDNGEEVEVNGDSVDGLVASVTDATTITSISLAWSTDGEVFLTEGDTMMMPVFEEFGLVFNGLDFGDVTEDISFDAGDAVTLSMGNYDFDLSYNSSTEEYLGGDGHELVSVQDAAAVQQVFPIGDDERFLATLLDANLGDIETAYYEVTSLDNDTATFDLSLNDLIGDDDIDFEEASAGDDEDATSSINVKVLAVFDSGDEVPSAYNVTGYNDTGYVTTAGLAEKDFAVLNVSSDSALQWDTVVSEEGLVAEFSTTAGVGQTIKFYETADDGDVVTTLSGEEFTVTIGWDSGDGLYGYLASSPGITMVDETADNKEVGYDTGVHATMIKEDSEDNTLEIEFYPAEVTADLKLIAGGEASTSTSEAGVMTVTDSEVASVAGKKLIVVGGSAINSVAADLLGSAYREAAFTEATDVAAGQFLIQYFESEDAILVAGYNAEDTEMAGTYMSNEGFDLSDEKVIGTSVSEATVVTA